MAFLFNTLVMVIVYTSIKNILFKYQQQGNLIFMLQIYFPNSFIQLMHKRMYFSYFLFARLIQFALL
jgi:hypothetical protein